MNNSASLLSLLQKEVMDLNERSLQIPYVSDLQKKNIPIESSVGHLRSLAIIYGTLENQLSKLDEPEINSMLRDYQPKLPIILSNLEALNAHAVKDIIPCINHALHVADKILLYTVKSPYKLLGFLYVLNGSISSELTFNQQLSAKLETLVKEGNNHEFVFNQKYKPLWDESDAEMLQNLHSEEIVAAANELSELLISIYESLYPIDEKLLGNHITALNPEAGNFPIPTNPMEIEAAIEAGMICWNEFSFYEKRYGERGKRFTISDSVWLVTLHELPFELALNQVLWLAKYLANRGMPVITMEYHLKYLYQELAKRIPENEPNYKTLLDVSEQLKKQRTDKISDSVFEKSNALFHDCYKQFNAEDAMLQNTGLLIASSIADSKNGMNESMVNFKTWLTDPELFSSNWIQAIEKTYSVVEN
jgi:hypothetical protein